LAVEKSLKGDFQQKWQLDDILHKLEVSNHCLCRSYQINSAAFCINEREKKMTLATRPSQLQQHSPSGTGCPRRLWMPHPGGIQGQAGCGSGQPCLVVGDPAHSRGVETQ